MDKKNYDSWLAGVEDDDEIRSLKKEREELLNLMTNRSENSKGVTSTELKELELQLIRLEIQRSGLREKAKDQATRKQKLQ